MDFTTFSASMRDSLSISFNTVNASCFQNNGSAIVIVNGGTPNTIGSPYQYNWFNGNSTLNNNNLEAGYYPITVIDSRGCLVTDSAFVKGTHNVFADSLSELKRLEYFDNIGGLAYICFNIKRKS